MSAALLWESFVGVCLFTGGLLALVGVVACGGEALDAGRRERPLLRFVLATVGVVISGTLMVALFATLGMRGQS